MSDMKSVFQFLSKSINAQSLDLLDWLAVIKLMLMNATMRHKMMISATVSDRLSIMAAL